MAKKTADFESRMQRLEAIVSQLEESDLPLEKGMALFKEGVDLAKSCRRQLLEAKNEVQVYVKGVLEDFDLDQPGGTGHGDEDAEPSQDV